MKQSKHPAFDIPKPETKAWSLEDWGLLLEAGFTLARARLLVRRTPFPKLAKRFGQLDLETPKDTPNQKAEKIGWAVKTAAKCVPWRSECLEQAVCAKLTLKQKRYPSTMYFGTLRNGLALQAHAWVRCGNLVVVGDVGHQVFIQIAVYGDD